MSSYMDTIARHIDARKQNVPAFLPLESGGEEFSVKILHHLLQQSGGGGVSMGAPYDPVKVPIDAAMETIVNDFNVDDSMLQGVLPQAATQLLERLVKQAMADQPLYPTDFQLLAVYLVGYRQQCLDSLRSIKVKQHSTRRSASSTAYRPAQTACDKLVSSLLLTLNTPSSADQSALVHAVCCLAYLVPGHSNEDSILGVTSNVLQMTRLCLSRAVYPGTEAPVWDVCLGRQALLTLLKMPRVCKLEEQMQDVRNFITKWVTRLAAAAPDADVYGNAIDTSPCVSTTGNRSSRPNAKNTSSTSTKSSGSSSSGLFPSTGSVTDSDPPFTARSVISLLNGLLQLYATEYRMGMDGTSCHWIIRHFSDVFGEVVRGRSVVEILVMYIGCACPFTAYAAMELACTLHELEDPLAGGGKPNCVLAQAVMAPVEQLRTQVREINSYYKSDAGTAMQEALFSKAQEIQTWSHARVRQNPHTRQWPVRQVGSLQERQVESHAQESGQEKEKEEEEEKEEEATCFDDMDQSDQSMEILLPPSAPAPASAASSQPSQVSQEHIQSSGKLRGESTGATPCALPPMTPVDFYGDNVGDSSIDSLEHVVGQAQSAPLNPYPASTVFDQQVNESMASLSLTSASPVAICAASQLPRSQSQPSQVSQNQEQIPRQGKQVSNAVASQISSITAATTSPTTTTATANVAGTPVVSTSSSSRNLNFDADMQSALALHASLQTQLLQEQRQVMSLQADTSTHAAVVAAKDALLTQAYEQVQTLAQRLEKVCRCVCRVSLRISHLIL